MKIEKYGIYLADLNPRSGSEPGKIRPVVVMQTDLLNRVHPSTIVLPITTKVKKDTKLLRVHLDLAAAGLKKPSDIMVDQIRSIDNRRFLKYTGTLSPRNRRELTENLQILIFE